jgi:hypothetical protein
VGTAPLESAAPLDTPGPSALPPPSATIPRPTREPNTETTRTKIEPVDLRVDIPAGWLGAEPDDLESLGELPAVQTALDDLESTVLVFAAVDLRGLDGSPIGDNLTIFDLGSSVPARGIELGAKAIAAALETLPEVQGTVAVAMVGLPIGQAARLRFTYEGEVELAVEAYSFNSGSHLVLTAFSAPALQITSSRPVFTTIADSFRAL